MANDMSGNENMEWGILFSKLDRVIDLIFHLNMIFH